MSTFRRPSVGHLVDVHSRRPSVGHLVDVIRRHQTTGLVYVGGSAVDPSADLVAARCSIQRYRRAMPWSPENRRARHPEIQAGWELIGSMVKRRRRALGWTQRELSHRCGLDQAAICRLERGTLRGLRFKRFVAIVVAMGGLDPGLPAPARRPRVIDLFTGPDTPPGDGPLPDWLPHRDEPRPATIGAPAARQPTVSLDVADPPP